MNKYPIIALRVDAVLLRRIRRASKKNLSLWVRQAIIEKLERNA